MSYADSPAADRNKKPILAVLKTYIKANDRVLEIGSGTGQHAVYFCEHLDNIAWQTSDLIENLANIGAHIAQASASKPLQPIELNVADPSHWPNEQYNIVYSANTTHIMHWEEVKLMIEMVSQVLMENGLFILYGPFNSNDQFSSESNAAFDAHLKSIASHMGIRDLEDISSIAKEHSLSLIDRHDMPSNNRMIVFSKKYVS